ncbi:MAG: chloride channel protein [Chitinophagales bacterium]|nr:chloride channel protein [Chitinophagales bacterium]
MSKSRKYYLLGMKWVSEHSSPYQSIIVLSVAIGLLSGIAAITLKSLIHFIESYGVGFFPSYLFFLTPVTGILIVVFLNQNIFGKAAAFHGIGDIITSIRRKSSVIDFTLTYVKLITSAITVGLGGSSGLESPIVVTGSAIGSNVARFFRLDVNYKSLFIGCGAAAGISAIFNAPIAGVVFAMEVLMPRFTATYFIPVLLSSASGALLAEIFSPSSIFSVPQLEWKFVLHQLPFIVTLGVLGGLVSFYFTRMSWISKTVFSKIRNPYSRGIVGGALLGALVFCFPRLYGEGYVGIRSLFLTSGYELLPPIFSNIPLALSWALPLTFFALFILKPIAATITIHAGGEGGHFAPSFITGGYLGYFFFLVAGMFFPSLQLSAPVFILLGMSSVLSGVMHAPLTGIFLIAEITGGYELFVPLMVVSALGFLTKYAFEKQPIHFHRGESPLAGSKELAVLDTIELLNLADHDYLTIQPTQSLREMLPVLTGSKRNFFPVLDEQNNLLGIITLDDLRPVMFDTARYDVVFAKDLMHMPSASLQWDERLVSALEKFDRTGYWNLPVVRNGKFAGFISKSTILDRLRKEVDRNQEIF